MWKKWPFINTASTKLIQKWVILRARHTIERSCDTDVGGCVSSTKTFRRKKRCFQWRWIWMKGVKISQTKPKLQMRSMIFSWAPWDDRTSKFNVLPQIHLCQITSDGVSLEFSRSSYDMLHPRVTFWEMQWMALP